MEQVLKELTLDYFGQGKHKITPDTFFQKENGYFLDVRSKEEASSIAIKLEHHTNLDVVNIPIDEIPDRIGEVPKDKYIAVFCPAGVRSSIVYAYLLSHGFPDVQIIEGGYSALTEALKPGPIYKAVQRNK